MRVLGRLDMLEPKLELTEVNLKHEDGLPVEMPEADETFCFAIVFCAYFKDGTKTLTVCKDLKEMRSEAAWVGNWIGVNGVLDFRWFIADYVECMKAWKNHMSHTVPPL